MLDGARARAKAGGKGIYLKAHRCVDAAISSKSNPGFETAIRRRFALPSRKLGARFGSLPGFVGWNPWNAYEDAESSSLQRWGWEADPDLERLDQRSIPPMREPRMWQLTDDELRQAHAAAKVAADQARSLPRTPANVDIEERYLRLSAKLKERGLTPMPPDKDKSTP